MSFGFGSIWSVLWWCLHIGILFWVWTVQWLKPSILGQMKSILTYISSLREYGNWWDEMGLFVGNSWGGSSLPLLCASSALLTWKVKVPLKVWMKHGLCLASCYDIVWLKWSCLQLPQVFCIKEQRGNRESCVCMHLHFGTKPRQYAYWILTCKNRRHHVQQDCWCKLLATKSHPQ